MTYLCPKCPIGVNPPSDGERDHNIWPVKSGDSWTLNTRITLPDGVTPANPANSQVHFALAEDQFCDPPIWVGTWDDGVYEVDPNNHPGLVKITIPDEIADCLRRGSYRFSMAVSDRFGRETHTPLEGTMLVEYTPSGPQHDVPYRGELEDAP